MNKLFVFVFLILFVLVIAGTIYMIYDKNKNTTKQGKCIVKEPKFTLFLGIFLWGEAIAILFICYVYPERLVNSTNSYINTTIFLILSILGGSFVFLYTLIREFAASELEITYINFLGRSSFMLWKDIVDVHKKGQAKIQLVDRNLKKIDIQGDKKQFFKFISFASKKINNIEFSKFTN